LFALNHRITRTQVSLRIPGDAVQSMTPLPVRNAITTFRKPGRSDWCVLWH
jgi:hypothetical protein